MNSTDRQPFASQAVRITCVELTWLESRIEHWIRFVRIAEDHIIDRRHRIVGFAPDSIFAFVRWAANDFGTIISRIDILRATAQDESYTTVPFIRPGGEILLRIHGWPKVERLVIWAAAMSRARWAMATLCMPWRSRPLRVRLTCALMKTPYCR